MVSMNDIVRKRDLRTTMVSLQFFLCNLIIFSLLFFAGWLRHKNTRIRQLSHDTDIFAITFFASRPHMAGVTTTHGGSRHHTWRESRSHMAGVMTTHGGGSHDHTWRESPPHGGSHDHTWRESHFLCDVFNFTRIHTIQVRLWQRKSWLLVGVVAPTTSSRYFCKLLAESWLRHIKSRS